MSLDAQKLADLLTALGTFNAAIRQRLDTKLGANDTAVDSNKLGGMTLAQVQALIGDAAAADLAALSAEFDAFVARTDNPHAVTKAQVGLGDVDNFGTATNVEAVSGLAANKFLTPANLAAFWADKVGTAPETLDTIQELAAALQNNPDALGALQTIAGDNSAAITQLNTDLAAALVTAANDATAKADAAQAAAIAAAALDATAKADAAAVDAKAYTDVRETAIRADVTSGLASKLGALDTAVDSAKLEGLTKAQVIAEAQAGVDLSQVVLKSDDFGVYSVGGQTLTALVAALQAADATNAGSITAVQTALNNFIAAKASSAEAVAGLDDSKYITALSLKAATDAAIAGLVDGAPTALDTLNELALALASEGDAVAALTVVVDTKLNQAQVQAEIAAALVPVDARIDTEKAALQVSIQGVQDSATANAAAIAATNTDVAGVDARVGTLEAAMPSKLEAGDAIGTNTVTFPNATTQVPEQQALDTVVEALRVAVEAAESGAATDLATLQASFNAFVASKATSTEAVAGTDDVKYITSLSAKAAIDAAIDALVGAAPAALDTINELAAALNNDPDIINTLMAQIGTKLDQAQVQAEIDAALSELGVSAPLDMRIGTSGEAQYMLPTPDALSSVGVVHGLIKGSQFGLTGPVGMRLGVVTIYGQLVEPIGTVAADHAAIRREFRSSATGAIYTQNAVVSGAGTVEDPYVYSWGIVKQIADLTSTVLGSKSQNTVGPATLGNKEALIGTSPINANTAFLSEYLSTGVTAVFEVYAGETNDAGGTANGTLVVPGMLAELGSALATEAGLLKVSLSGNGTVISRTFEVENYIYTQKALTTDAVFSAWERVGSMADDSAKLEGQTLAQVIAQAQAGVDMSNVVQKTDDFGQYSVGGSTLTALVAALQAVDTDNADDVIALQNAFNAFVAAKASSAEVIAGTDDAKYTTSLGVKAAVTAAIDALVGAAPAALDTINELAAALNNDPDVINNLTSAIGTKLEANAQAVDSAKLEGKTIADLTASDLDVATGTAVDKFVTPASLKSKTDAQDLGIAANASNISDLMTQLATAFDNAAATL
ncbi:hypothetical protein D3C85_15950 [compost metagenome]